jgi:outer membrane protein, heavy metal efflux system
LCVVMAFLTGCATYHPKPLFPSQTAASFEARTLDSLDLKKHLGTNLDREIAPWPPVSWDFSMLVLAALYYHPDLDVARAKWGVAQAGVITAKQHPNPTIGFTPQYDINPGSGIPSPWILDFKLDIPIETAGKRGYRIAQANHLVEAARLNVAATAWQVRSRLRASLLNLFWAGQLVLAIERQISIQEDLVKLMEKRLAVGEVSQPEVTQARLSLDQAQFSLSDAKKKIAEAQSQTADALGITVNALNEIKISFVFFEEPVRKPPPAELRRQALFNRSDLLSALAEYAASESALRLEIAKQYPDISIGPAYTFDQGENKWGLGLSLTLPILNQNQGPIAEAEARRTESGAVFVSLQAKVIGEIDLGLAGYEAALRKLVRAEALVSDNERQQRSTQAMFDAGEADRLALLGAHLELLSSRLSRLDALVQSQQSLGLLEDALQRPLDLSGSLLAVPEKNSRPIEER